MEIITSLTYILYGVLIIVLTHTQPTAYWNNRCCKFWRGLIGDQATVVCSSCLGVVLILMGNALLQKTAI